MEFLTELTPSNTRTAVALGFFDGMHRGHQAVIKAAIDCKEQNMVPTVLTFSEQPRAVLSGTPHVMLVNKEKRIKLFENTGIEKLYYLNFPDIQRLTAEEFVNLVLLRTLKAKRVFCGFNYHFGCGGTADCEELKRLCRLNGIIVTVNNPVIYQGNAISSSRIRECIKSGDMISACTMLGRCFSLELPVIKGRQLGRTLGTPTINQDIPENCILPRFGVYASFVTVDGERVPAVTNIGVKPTVGTDRPLAETWILSDKIHDLYGKTVEVSFIKFLRSEKKFNSIDELKAEIKSDGERAEKIFKAFHS